MPSSCTRDATFILEFDRRCICRTFRMLSNKRSQQSCRHVFGLTRLQETDTCELKSTRMPDIRRGEENCHRQGCTKPWRSSPAISCESKAGAISTTLTLAVPQPPSKSGQTSRPHQACVGLLQQERVRSAGRTTDYTPRLQH